MMMRSLIRTPQTNEEIELCIYGSIVDFVIRVSYPAGKGGEYAKGYTPSPELGCLRVKTVPGHCIVSGILDEKLLGDSKHCKELVDKILEENMEITEELHCAVQVVRQVELYELKPEESEEFLN